MCICEGPGVCGVLPHSPGQIVVSLYVFCCFVRLRAFLLSDTVRILTVKFSKLIQLCVEYIHNLM